MAEEQTPETPTGETPATPLQEPPAAPETEEVGAQSEETSTPEEAPAAEPPSISGGAPEDSPLSTAAEGAAASAPEATSEPRVFAFGCPNGRAVTFVQEHGHGDAHGGPVIPRDVRCPVCGHNMILQEPSALEEFFNPTTAEVAAT